MIFLEDSPGNDLLAELKEREQARRLLQGPRQRRGPWAAGLEGLQPFAVDSRGQ